MEIQTAECLDHFPPPFQLMQEMEDHLKAIIFTLNQDLFQNNLIP